jgi:hypothetical protein
MSDGILCDGCGEPLAQGTTICRHCGWDMTTAVTHPPRISLWNAVRTGGWRVLLYGALLALPVLGFARFRTTGPGPDLGTTLRWMALGDGGRAAELVTIHRAHEIGSAAARYAVRELEAPPFDGDWQRLLAPYATMWVRGWMPLLFYGATTDMAPRSVREFYDVRSDDGWGRPYRIETRALPRDDDRTADEQVAADLIAGLQVSFFKLQNPEFDRDTDWMRLEVVSAGRDGSFDTDDDLRMVSYMPVGFTLRLTRRPEDLQRQMEAAYTRGRHHFRIEGSRWDLIDARLLAEHRLEYLP